MNSLHNKRFKAFTLQELLIVLVIIGILVLVSLPVLMPLISRTRSVEATQATYCSHNHSTFWTEVLANQEAYYFGLHQAGQHGENMLITELSIIVSFRM